MCGEQALHRSNASAPFFRNVPLLPFSFSCFPCFLCIPWWVSDGPTERTEITERKGRRGSLFLKLCNTFFFFVRVFRSLMMFFTGCVRGTDVNRNVRKKFQVVEQFLAHALRDLVGLLDGRRLGNGD